MDKLHQLDVFGSRLVVEYARTSHSSVVHEARLDKYVYQTLWLFLSCLYCNTETPTDSLPGGLVTLVKMS